MRHDEALGFCWHVLTLNLHHHCTGGAGCLDARRVQPLVPICFGSGAFVSTTHSRDTWLNRITDPMLLLLLVVCLVGLVGLFGWLVVWFVCLFDCLFVFVCLFVRLFNCVYVCCCFF